MADNIERGEASSDLAALQIAMPSASAEAREYLRKQSKLADLQIDTLQKKDEFELSHLRFQRFSDYARFALEIAAFLVVLLIVCGLGTMVWNAAHDHDLVADAFSVPPDIAQSGMTGAVLAGRVLDRFGAMQSGTIATTQAADSYHSGSSEEVRVEIPDTGISIGELNRYLCEWLGNETHVGGDLVHTAKGLALTLRYGGQPGTTFAGTDLDTLVRKSAEHLFAAARPLRFAEYLKQSGRTAEALAIIVPLTVAGADKERALAYADWASVLLAQGDFAGALKKGRQAVQLDPDNPTARGWLQTAEDLLGHMEASRNDAAADIAPWRGPDSAMFDPTLVEGGPLAFTAYEEEAEGDFAAAVPNLAQATRVEPQWISTANQVADLASAHDIAAARALAASIPALRAGGKPNPDLPEVRMDIAFMQKDWPIAVTAAKAEEAIERTVPIGASYFRTYLRTRLAVALARSGNIAAAEALMAHISIDNDRALCARGQIAAAKHDWAAAARWFAIVSARTAHVPFADTDWGDMLLHKGDYNGAIAKFKEANKKGPHFADPLEMWGEALIAKNRSDLALAKFAEADKYAPNWGRLHLKWGEALWWSGDHDGAQKQFAIAHTLDLTPSEKSELRKVSHG
jgi:tetratricopeptide (TPR) repeat protein